MVLDYYANTAAFAKNCINKAMPEMKCNGKCQLMKKLREEQEKQQQNPERKAELKTELVTPAPFFHTLQPDILITEIEPANYYAWLAPEIVSSDIFHPPRG